MIKKIKHNRIRKDLDAILSNCYKGYVHKYHYQGSVGDKFFSYYGMFSIFDDDEIEVNYPYFLSLGVSNKITVEELKDIIHERFTTRDKI